MKNFVPFFLFVAICSSLLAKAFRVSTLGVENFFVVRSNIIEPEGCFGEAFISLGGCGRLTVKKPRIICIGERK